MRELIQTYDALLLDAYGVLVDARDALPGARELMEVLRSEGKRFVVVTNDASRLPETAARRFASFGLEVASDEIVTSGSLLAPVFAARGLSGARCLVLGPDDSRTYVERAGGVVVPPAIDGCYDAVIVCDEAGYPFLEWLDIALSALIAQLDRGESPVLVVPNPDLIYPDGRGGYGFTAGGAVLLLEAGLERRFGEAAPRFERLGKPHRPMFDAARLRAGTERVVMIGDQLETDIVGARAAGIDAALLATGVSRWEPGRTLPGLEPTHLLSSLQP
jgi:HAD superfamily hydrolase (TIGR01450 family)